MIGPARGSISDVACVGAAFDFVGLGVWTLFRRVRELVNLYMIGLKSYLQKAVSLTESAYHA